MMLDGSGTIRGAFNLGALLVLLFGLLLHAAGCPRRHGTTPPLAGEPANSSSPAKQGAAGHSNDETSNSDAADSPQLGPPKQIVLIYTGDTLSIPQANEGYKPPEGGLSALTAAIADYETQIVDYNRLRVQTEGGDLSQVRVDFKAGMLGDHPYMLLDYGGWERPNDQLGELYVALYLRMFSDMRYFAVGAKLYERLPPERWEAYGARGLELRLLASAGEPQDKALPAAEVFTRELHGALWGVVCAPLPRMAGDPEARMNAFVEQAAAELTRSGCKFGILFAAGGPASMYDALAKDQRFAVVLGGPKRLAPPDGFGPLPAGGPLLLPELNGGGRELGVCHLIYPKDGERPAQYFFTRIKVLEDAAQPYPYRQQVAQTVAEHEAQAEKLKAQERGS